MRRPDEHSRCGVVQIAQWPWEQRMPVGSIRAKANGVGRATRESLGCQAKELVFALKARES